MKPGIRRDWVEMSAAWDADDEFETGRAPGRLQRLRNRVHAAGRIAWYATVGPVLCWALGHDDEVDETTGGGEYGRVDWSCKRCGRGGRGWF